MINRYGLDESYFREKLNLIVRDADNYTPSEMARALLRLSVTADQKVISEEEFSKYKIGYDDKSFCCKCKGRNKVGTITTESGYIAECTTTCSACSHEDYWAYGFYQSKGES